MRKLYKLTSDKGGKKGQEKMLDTDTGTEMVRMGLAVEVKTKAPRKPKKKAE